MEALFGIGALAVLLGIAILLYVVPVTLWLSAVTAGVKVRISELIGMRLRTVPPSAIIRPLIAARKAGIDVTASMLETHYLAGGNVQQTVNALLTARGAGQELTFYDAAALDLVAVHAAPGDAEALRAQIIARAAEATPPREPGTGA